ncbi:MAG TPA: hypothetical protein VGK25_07150 [Ignavibacteria bacterium]
MKNSKSTITVRTKISKGYRLKPSTHKLIKKLQQLLNTSQDAVISSSVKLFHKGLRNNEKKHNSTNNLITNLNKGNTTK